MRALDGLARPGERRTLEQIATENGMSLSELTSPIEAEIAAHRAGR
ncbi:hypothetical protein RGQ15_16495 [Paracoccus sp. MBLB3053]|uniref:Uncharacterized protein n=1 Tax=Paracoccus aurantius TaxID=3073814 RepID=A0ABU2HVS8_9RHOB|nr:hypothetical protein [Paracoccus sp. MBLB3053]MDS9469162.1 hypothetical protein [Paracoccus sp. MBLB3053]